MTASTSKVKDELRVVIPKTGDEVEVLENGGISPNLSVRTDDDACSEIIRIEQGIDLANAVAHYIFQDRLRQSNEKQHTYEPVGYSMPETLREAIILMERNLEEPLALKEIAHYAGISQRQLARLFNRYTKSTPIKYYINIRLEQARKLVTQTELSLIEIAGICGFKHAEQLSRSYKTRFGMPPSKHRIEGRIPFQFRR